jgi:hypothetical protein
MRATSFVLALVVLLAGCNQQPQRQPKMSDTQLRLMRSEMPGITDECLDKAKWGGVEAMPKAEECFRFSKSQRMQGLWRNQFEGSEFCESSDRRCPDPKTAADPESFIWLELELPAGYEDTPPGGLYAIDFVGRRSLGGGMFGHFGVAKHEVLVDRLLSIKLVEAPPPGQMTKAHVEGYLKDCAGKKLCMPNSEIPKSK